MRRLLAILVPAAVLASCAPAAVAAEPAAAKTGDNGVRTYWTEARMQAAIPREVAPAELPATAAAGDRGRARVVEPKPAHTGSVNRTEITDPATYPARLHGKVFLSLGAFDYVCSGTVVNSPSRSLVVTAGHCVYERGIGYASNFMFVPGYRDGARPYGSWVAKRLATTAGYEAGEDLRYDVGMAVMRRDSQGRGIQTVVGARGIAFNRARNQFYRSYGYPATGAFDGERLYRCDSPWGGNDASFSEPRPMFIHCDFTGGSSGGGWVIDDRYVFGLNSYKYDDDLLPVLPTEEPTHMYGPYFGDSVLALYRSVKGRKSRCQGRAVTHLGTPGNDSITGTPGDDVIRVRGGDDVVNGGGGQDRICGGGGDDLLKGKAGADHLDGGRGSDSLRGGKGRRDRCDGGPDRDRARSCEHARRIP